MNNYDILKYTPARKILANCDKCSANGESNVVRSVLGVIRMYHTSAKRGRFYSVSGSSILHNGGSYKMSTFRAKLRGLV